MTLGEPVACCCAKHAGMNACPDCPLHGGAPIRTEFRSATEREAYFAHLAPDDPVRRQIGGFDFPNILDEGEIGYR